jgi:glucose-6-phosphate isomerase
MDIKFDFGNLFVPRIAEPYGILPEDVDKLSGRLSEAQEKIARMRKDGKLVFSDMPYKDEIVTQVNDIAAKYAGQFENLLTIGIGGSALGANAIFNALGHPYHNLLDKRQRDNKPRLFFLDNIDPIRIKALLDVLDVKKTLINVISKSGSTVETIANFLVLRERLIAELGRQSYNRNLIITTSEGRGDLWKIAEEENIDFLPVPEGLGGRYSVLSPVGLLSASLLGIDIAEFMSGARSMDRRIKDERDIWKNPACLHSCAHYIADTGRGLNVFAIMPYSHSLRTFSDWCAQLIAESLGKITENEKNVGPTPVKALGVTDQHSQLQLYVQGPMDKVVTFVAVEDFGYECPIPKAYDGYKSIKYLGGSTLNDLFDAERKATELSLTKNNRLNCTIYLPRITPYTLGQLFYFYEASTVHMGQLYNVDPLDQPGVEESKVYAKALMGHDDHEEKKQEVEVASGKTGKYRL